MPICGPHRTRFARAASLMHRQLAYPSCGELLAQIKIFPRIQKSVPFSEAGGQPLSTFVLFRCQEWV